VIISHIATNSYNAYGNTYLNVAALLQGCPKTLIPHFISNIMENNTAVIPQKNVIIFACTLLSSKENNA